MQNKIYNKIWGRKKVLTTSRAFQLTSSGGFTLIETLVAITLLVLAITGPLQIASNALFSSYYARDEITSYYLAVEGIEYIKNARDSLFLSDVFVGPGSRSNWLFDFDPCLTDGNDPTFQGCIVNTTKNFNTNHAAAIEVCDLNTGCPRLRYDPNTGFWGYDIENTLAVETKFTRKITIIPQVTLSGQDEAIIKVEVSWPSRDLLGGDKTFSLTDIMTNWQRK